MQDMVASVQCPHCDHIWARAYSVTSIDDPVFEIAYECIRCASVFTLSDAAVRTLSEAP